MDAIANDKARPGALAASLLRLHAAMAERGAHPARTVVLVPYAQLMPVARSQWAAQVPDGFSPRFETTMNWAGRTGFAPGPVDLSFDRGLDLLTAREWLERAGLAAQAAVLAPRLVDAAWQLAGCAAAVSADERPAWAVQARAAAGLGLEHPVLAIEAAILRIAIEWAAASAYASDALLVQPAAEDLDLLVVLEGLQPDPVTQAVQARAGNRALSWPLAEPAPVGEIRLYTAPDPAHEAEMAAACVMQHLQSGRAPVALADVDRALTRRIRAMLGARGVAVSDETGWKLSTTRAGAQVMTALKACAWNASSDEVLDWLKNTPAVAPRTGLALERRVRRAGLRSWRAVDARRLGGEPGTWSELIEQANGWRERLRATRTLVQWLQALRDLLQTMRLWERLCTDSAGAQLVAVLSLDEAGQDHWSQLPQSARRMQLADFTQWVGEALEAASFVPDRPTRDQVVVLPFSQLLGRHFAALVVPGCDELRLAPSPEPAGPWTAAQRAALGLPSREQLEQQLRAGWRNALQTAQVDLLVRQTDDTGEPVLPSPLVQELLLDGLATRADEPRESRALEPHPVARPQACAPELVVSQLSASAYEDLRRCPYRFFALRQLGLQEADEIDSDLDKRDFGNWLHEVLRRFHEGLRDGAQADTPALRRTLIDEAAKAVTRELQMPEGEFLPFEAAWPQVREGYLAQLEKFEADEGARFATAETQHEVQVGSVRLIGRIDRVDVLPSGTRMVMDYKTESSSVTSARVKLPLEDTQLAFYAALLEDDEVRAAYVNVGERGETKFIEQPSVLDARDALIEGIVGDLRRIADGARLQALGEGQVCEWCAARGLCRKDFWTR